MLGLACHGGYNQEGAKVQALRESLTNKRVSHGELNTNALGVRPNYGRFKLGTYMLEQVGSVTGRKPECVHYRIAFSVRKVPWADILRDLTSTALASASIWPPSK